ncbi:MAG: hypothetical protein A3B65_05090 [Acidobacteria bacterium RIFCSPHIGHO2_02_FULL_67_57]|nr:MAG: hypothetical protein A3B65_05090 [Acidobacteria bacterium RIFCSPHIGHO2_02_FULL_67_57]OFV86204.1 MAG: hypothetical protein A2620_08045 [Acidobacteria bacterium RIFCSPHIGHO2_01_FULL_67_28]
MGQSPQAPSSSSGGLEPNVAALLGYLFWPLAIVWLVVDPYKQDRFIRFHSFQALGMVVAMFALWIGFIVLSIILGVAGLGAVAGILWLLFGLAFFVLWILLMVKAYQKQMWKLPVLGNFCEQQANKV